MIFRGEEKGALSRHIYPAKGYRPVRERPLEHRAFTGFPKANIRKGSNHNIRNKCSHNNRNSLSHNIRDDLSHNCRRRPSGKTLWLAVQGESGTQYLPGTLYESGKGTRQSERIMHRISQDKDRNPT